VGNKGCRLTGVTATTGSLSIAQITVDRLDFERINNGQLPDAVTLRMQDIVIRNSAVLGPFDVAAEYDLDVRAKVFTLKELTLRGPSFGELTLSGEVEGYSLPDDGGFWPPDEQDTVRLRQFRLRAVDRGFISMLLLGQSSSERDRPRWPDFGVPRPAVEALTAFVQDLPSPRHPITISATPSAPIPLARLDPTDPGLRQAMERLNLVVTY
ncbi:MAG: hypothetical protein JF625_02335, partial [Inquilinus limosus]|nr:hypothetical protein [Inquilinus limosus]